jgi:hypothetical protein
MLLARLNALWLSLGAFGGELTLLLALPAIGRLYGAPAVAILSIATVGANVGKLLGSLKVDAAIANADDPRVGATHAAAVAAIVATSAAALLLFWALDGLSVLPQAAAAAGPVICGAFAGGAVQQASSMRLLRENRLGAFALMKAFTSLMLVIIVFGLRPQSLMSAYLLANAATVLAAAAWHLRRPAPGGPGLLPATRHELRQARGFIVQGAPAAALDGANMFLLSVITVWMAGAAVAGEAAQMQRIALGPSLAASLLLSQHVWRQRFAPDDAGAWRRDAGVVVRGAAAAAVLSAAVLCGLLWTPPGRGLVHSKPGDALGIIACLAPLLAQYTVSACTVYFFKRERLHLYARLQVTLLACLGAVAGLSLATSDPALRALLLLPLAGAILLLTATLARRAVIS